MSSVLVVGYGKIGSIKSGIWRRLGFRVIVVDKELKQLMAARQEDFEAYTHIDKINSETLDGVLITDISVPAGHHGQTLSDALNKASNCRVALVEKPIVSSKSELNLMKMALSANLGVRVVVNESYYASKGLESLLRYLSNSSAKRTDISVTFSKNRLPDVRQGRFVDDRLGPYGIEVPHMLACLKYLGYEKANPTKNTWLRNVDDQPGSEGMACDMLCDDTNIRLIESLGPFEILPNHKFSPEPMQSTVRMIVVTFDDLTQATLEFDPIPSLPRYHSRLTTKNGASIIADDHMYRMLSRVARYASGDLSAWSTLQPASFEEAAKDNDKLFELSANAVVRDYSKAKSFIV